MAVKGLPLKQVITVSPDFVPIGRSTISTSGNLPQAFWTAPGLNLPDCPPPPAIGETVAEMAEKILKLEDKNRYTYRRVFKVR